MRLRIRRRLGPLPRQQMNRERLKALLPHASASMLALNATDDLMLPREVVAAAGRSASEPNKTEAEYGRLLESQKLCGEIIEYRYEGITLRWADMKYTPDWFVVVGTMTDDIGNPMIPRPIGTHLAIRIIEVKGGHIFDRDIVRFKGARAAWPLFQFEMHQKKAGEWRRLH